MTTDQPRPPECCGVCPPIMGGGYDCTCQGNPRCPGPATARPSVEDARAEAERIARQHLLGDVLDNTRPWSCECGESFRTNRQWSTHVIEVALAASRAVPSDSDSEYEELAAEHQALVRKVRACRNCTCSAVPSDREGVGTGAGEGDDPASTEATSWVTRSTDCPEAPAQAHPLPPAVPSDQERAVSHIGRSFNDTRLEDGCPCPKGPCGLAIFDGTEHGCDQHDLGTAQTIRQMHSAADCPAASTAPGEDVEASIRLFPICGPCVRAEGAECHTPGCALYLHTVPDHPLHEELGYDQPAPVPSDHTATTEDAARALYEAHGWSGCAGSAWSNLPGGSREGWEYAAGLLATARPDTTEAQAQAWDQGHRVGWEHRQDGNYGTDYWDDDTPNPYRAGADS